jgi:hypothetical protein
MVEQTVTEESRKPGVAPSGSGYRAIVTSGGDLVWSCSHVHFTEHSARACAERYVTATEP